MLALPDPSDCPLIRLGAAVGDLQQVVGVVEFHRQGHRRLELGVRQQEDRLAPLTRGHLGGAALQLVGLPQQSHTDAKS